MCGTGPLRRGRSRQSLRQTTVPQSPSRLDPVGVTTEALQHELDRRHLETMLCAARLREAIHDAERWYARREQRLRQFDARLDALRKRQPANTPAGASGTAQPAAPRDTAAHSLRAIAACAAATRAIGTRNGEQLT
jgi:hypothetical protein